MSRSLVIRSVLYWLLGLAIVIVLLREHPTTIVYVAVFLLFGTAYDALLRAMLEDVNERQPKRISLGLGWSLPKVLLVWERHAALLPESKKRRLALTAFLIALLWMFSGGFLVKSFAQ